MSLPANRVDRIKGVVRKILSSRLESFPEDASTNRNAPFHDAFLTAFQDKLDVVKVDTPYLVAIASWMHGLNTTLGQTFFENVAHILSDSEKRKFTNVSVTQNQVTVINQIIDDLSNNRKKPNLVEEDQLLTEAGRTGAVEDVLIDITADVYRETADAVEAFELKTVRPNKGGGQGEKRKMLYAKAALARTHPDKQVRFYIGFPFDPTAAIATGFDKTKFVKHLVSFDKFYDLNEVLLAGELWDYLSGHRQTMEQVLEIVIETVREIAPAQ